MTMADQDFSTLFAEIGAQFAVATDERQRVQPNIMPAIEATIDRLRAERGLPARNWDAERAKPRPNPWDVADAIERATERAKAWHSAHPNDIDTAGAPLTPAVSTNASSNACCATHHYNGGRCRRSRA